MSPRPLRLAIIATHPIQYYSPLFRALHDRQVVAIRVFYNWDKGGTAGGFDPGFDRTVAWDVPLLDGYPYEFEENRSRRPGTDHFWGLQNPGLLSAVRRWSADAALVYGWNYASHLGLILRLRGELPIIFRGDSTLLDERPGPRKYLRRLVLRAVYRNITHALYVGERNREYFLAHGVPEQRLSWAPHSVDNDRFADPTGALDQMALRLRESLQIGAADVAILFVGKLEEKKAPDLLLETVLRYHDQPVHLLIAGSGPLEHGLKAKAAHCSRIHFLGFQNQSAMPHVYRAADIVALPSRGPGETWGLAVNEAMASERAVLVSDKVGCAQDLVGEGGGGLIFQSGSSSALKDALDILIGDSALRQCKARQGAQTIRQWSITEQAKRIEAAVSRVAGQSARVISE